MFLKECRYHTIERSSVFPQPVGINKQAGHDEHVTLISTAGLIDVDELHCSKLCCD
jgi:hypothetical protein